MSHTSCLAPLLLLCGGTLLAAERFWDRIAVTEVEVPVRVLVKGRPLAGLTREDFELYDDGEQQTIVGFSVREVSTRRLDEQGPSSAGPAAATGRRLLLLVDFSFSRRTRLALAMRGTRAAIVGGLDPDDRLAVATYGAVSGLNLLVGFTGDQRQIELAFDAVEAMLDAKRKQQEEILGRLHEARFIARDPTGRASVYETLVRELGPTAALAVLSGPVSYDEAEDDSIVIEEQRSFFGPIVNRVEVDVTAPIDIAQDRVEGPDVAAIRALGLSLAELAFLLREVGGPKDLVLLSEGFGGALLRDARSLFYLEKSFRALRDSGWMVHGIDVGGIPGLEEISFDSDSLLLLARETGGGLMENMNNFSRAAGRVLESTGIVYLLSFQPADPDDDDPYRELEVRLKDPPRGAQIYHRPGYSTERGPVGEEVYEQRVDAAAWLLTNLAARELDVKVYGETISDPLGGSRVPLSVEVAGASLAAVRSDRPTRVELRVVALDLDSQVREILTGEVRVDVRAQELMLREGGLRFLGELGLPPGEYRLRVLVRSRRGGEVFLDTYPLAVGTPGPILPPLPAAEERPAPGWLAIETERRSAYFQ